MRATIQFKDGHEESEKDAYPSIGADDKTVCFIDSDSGVLSDDFPLDSVKTIIWDND